MLGCADGPASFNAEATRHGLRVISCDPHQCDAGQIRARIEATFEDHEQALSRFRADSELNALNASAGRPFLASPFSETDASFSPTSRWVAYVSDESGRPEIYVTSFPAGAGRWQVSFVPSH